MLYIDRVNYKLSEEHKFDLGWASWDGPTAHCIDGLQHGSYRRLAISVGQFFHERIQLGSVVL